MNKIKCFKPYQWYLILILGYVERGVQASITGFKASNWAERNAATLLFSALITRIFGVKREKDADELSVKNCLTGSFFLLLCWMP